MKKLFWLSAIALMMMFPYLSWAASDDDPIGNVLVGGEEPALRPLQPSEYWLGIQCNTAPPALRAQLHLPENQGIVIEGIVPDSPAAKAGLVKFDVILKAGDKNLADVPDLLQAVDAAKDKEMKLEIIHDGKSKTVAITPAKRPEGVGLMPGPPPGGDFEAFRKWIEQMQPGIHFGQNAPLRFKFIRPGVILPPSAPIHGPLPGNMSITISKTGDKPADIVVKLGDDKWEVSEKELDKLPNNVRPYVERMLGTASDRGEGAMHWMPEIINPHANPQQPTPPGPGGPEAGVQSGQGPNTNLPLGPNFEKRIERRFEEMKQRMEKLERELRLWHQGNKTPDNPQNIDKNKELPPEEHAL